MKGKHLSIIAKKEFRGLFNEKTILLAVLLQLFIALFSSFLMVGLTSMYDPSSISLPLQRRLCRKRIAHTFQSPDQPGFPRVPYGFVDCRNRSPGT